MNSPKLSLVPVALLLALSACRSDSAVRPEMEPGPLAVAGEMLGEFASDPDGAPALATALVSAGGLGGLAWIINRTLKRKRASHGQDQEEVDPEGVVQDYPYPGDQAHARRAPQAGSRPDT